MVAGYFRIAYREVIYALRMKVEPRPQDYFFVESRMNAKKPNKEIEAVNVWKDLLKERNSCKVEVEGRRG
jgi:hypothetical protein